MLQKPATIDNASLHEQQQAEASKIDDKPWVLDAMTSHPQWFVDKGCFTNCDYCQKEVVADSQLWF